MDVSLTEQPEMELSVQKLIQEKVAQKIEEYNLEMQD